MPRPSLPQFLLAFLAGIVLLGIPLFVMPFIVPAPKSSVVEALRLSQSVIGGGVMYKVLTFHLPVTLLSGLFSLAVFRLLRVRDPWIAITLTIPWVIYCSVEVFSYYQAAPELFLLNWHNWFGRLSVALGILAASKVSLVKERGAA